MRSHDHPLAVAVAILLALSLLPAAATGGFATKANDGLEDDDAGAATQAPPPAESVPAQPAAPNIGAYRGLATWIDMYDESPYNHPVETVRGIARQGVRTIYLQTGNYSRPHDGRKYIFRHKIVSTIIETAHEHGIQVVAWYLPSFADPERDFDRSRAAIEFRTPNGHSFDGFALDIESPVVDNLKVRNRRLDGLSRRIKELVPESYALGAIVPEAHATYWPDFPYRQVAKHYDVFLPMAYHSFRISGYDDVARFMRHNIREIRRQTGDPDIPIHAIGGLAGDARDSEVRAFVDTVRQLDVIGGSVYDWPITPARHWPTLRRIKP